MAKLFWFALASFGLAGCTTNDPPSGSYTTSVSGQTCNTSTATTIALAGTTISVTYSGYDPPTTVTATNDMFDGDKVTFDSMVAGGNIDTGDMASGIEHYNVTVDGNTLSGTVDAMYNGTKNAMHYECTSTLGVTGTRATTRRSP